MVPGEQGQHFVTEEWMIGDSGAGFRGGNDDEIRDIVGKETDGVRLETRNQIHLHLGPTYPEDIHASHQPVEARITVNKNVIPFYTGSPMKPSGIRIGTPALTTRGMKETDVEKVADLIHQALQSKDDKAALEGIREEVITFNKSFLLPGSAL